MATTVTKVVDPNSGSGYDYASLSSWEAGQQGDLTGVRDEIAVAKCRCTGGTADTTAFTVDGWTTDSTRYIKIWTDPSESYRHNGTYQTGNKYRLESSEANNVIDNAEPYVKFIGLMAYRSNATLDNRCIIANSSSVGIEISSCILRGNNNTSWYDYGIDCYGGNGPIIICNNILYDFYASARYAIAIATTSSAGTGYIFNNTLKNCRDGISRTDGTVRAVNNILSCSRYAANGTFAAGSGYNATELASIGYTVTDGATGDRVSQTFTFVGAADFHLQSSDAGALGYGLNLYNDANYPFQDDIDGDDRGGAAAAWDIGADEYVAVGGSSIVPLLLYQYRARRQ